MYKNVLLLFAMLLTLAAITNYFAFWFGFQFTVFILLFFIIFALISIHDAVHKK